LKEPSSVEMRRGILKYWRGRKCLDTELNESYPDSLIICSFQPSIPPDRSVLQL
jgi:hypothetical protein